MSHSARDGSVSREFCRKCQGDFADIRVRRPRDSRPLSEAISPIIADDLRHQTLDRPSVSRHN